MSLKHRNLVAFVLILLASFCWPWGQELMYDDPSGMVTATTHPIVNSTVFSPQESTAASLESLPGDESHSTVYSESSSQPTHSPQETPDLTDNTQSLGRTLGFILCVTAAVFAVAAVVLLWQKAPLMGPDGLCMLIGMAGTIYHILQNIHATNLYSSLILSLLETDVTVSIFGGCVILITLREVWGWARAHFSVSWILLHRILKRCTLPQLSLTILMGWILLALTGVTYHLLWFHDHHRIYRLPIWSLTAAILCSLYYLWKYGSDLHHFQKQLTNYQNGTPVTVGDGSFANTEAQLLTVQAQHEEALRTAVASERFKVELIANVSHDLRTPLTSILGYSELLQQETLSPQGQEQLRQLYQKAGYMSDLVDSLFELTKVSSGVIQAKQEELDLIRLLEQTIGLFDDQLTHAGLTVRRNYCADSILLLTDGARMHQVFANLLGNAIKYALTGTRIYVEVKDHSDHYLIRMVNTASYEMDFSPEEMLQRFTRGDKARSTKGSGLGLAIAQTYTDSVGGTFRISIDGDQFSAIVELPKTERNL